jgi:serine/threonine protein kinase
MPHSILDEITPPRNRWWSLLPSFRVASRNKLPPATKLRYALEMAESLADLHGHGAGVIVHGDVHLGQWLSVSPDDSLVLNDFNLAKVLSWDSTKGEYCKVRRGRGNGNVSMIS